MARLAMSASKGGKRAIIRVNEEDYAMLIAISTDINEETHLPNVLGMAQCAQESHMPGWWRLKALYSDDPAATVLLMYSALKVFQRVLADESVSPEAQKIVKRYYDDAVKSGSKAVVQNADTYREETDPDFLKAGYLDPGKGPNMNTLMRSGTETLNAVVDSGETKFKTTWSLAQYLAEIADQGFEKAYENVERTGYRDFDQMLRSKAYKQILYGLEDAFYASGEEARRALSWYKENQDKVQEFVNANPKWTTFWKERVVPSMWKMEALRRMISDLIVEIKTQSS